MASVTLLDRLPKAPAAARSIRIAILAMGGEGGGVLADWLVEMAQANGHLAQMTSVPGVAQRTAPRSTMSRCSPRRPPPDGNRCWP